MNFKFISSIILFSTLCLSITYAQNCSPVGAFQTFYDPSCATGGVGCNAGGQNNCRFCGFDIYPPCPVATTQVPTSPTTTQTTTPRTTTLRTTTTRDPNAPTNAPVPFPYPVDLQDLPCYEAECLIFEDEFDKFDLKTWKHDLTMAGGGNWEFQLYHNNRTNSFVRDGVLNIYPTLTEERIGENNLRANFRMDMWGGSVVDQCTGNSFYGCERTSGAGGNILPPIQSAKISTQESFFFRYGRVEVRAKLPQGDWLWPAIWLLPRRNSYGMWPASGEIDIMESRGNVNYPNSAGGGVNSFGSTLHWGTDWSQNRYDLTHIDYHHSSKLSEEFHTYGLKWTEDRLFTYFDDESNVILDVDLQDKSFWEKGKFPNSYHNPWEGAGNEAPFNEEFYIILNLAVGGTAGYFPDNIGGKPWSDKSSSSVNEFYAAKNNWFSTWNNPNRAFQIDSVRVWKFGDAKKY